MAKKIISATKKGHDGFIPKIYAYANAPTVAPRVDELYRADKWVWFGKRNLWPEQMNDLATNNAILGRCFSLLAVLIAGKGVKFYDKKGDVIEEASNVCHGIRYCVLEWEGMGATSKRDERHCKGGSLGCYAPKK